MDVVSTTRPSVITKPAIAQVSSATFAAKLLGDYANMSAASIPSLVILQESVSRNMKLVTLSPLALFITFTGATDLILYKDLNAYQDVRFVCSNVRVNVCCGSTSNLFLIKRQLVRGAVGLKIATHRVRSLGRGAVDFGRKGAQLGIGESQGRATHGSRVGVDV
jgi:hypothetical protein